MDTKALAKSKRAHSQHHSKKYHPAQASKAGGAVKTANANKPLGNQAGDKSRPSQNSKALPSNWDRYGEEFDSGITDNSGNSTSRTSDIIVPKSKGADYGYLISEAKSQSQTSVYSESFPSLDDDLTGFNQGVGSLLSVWGQSFLSRTEDDTFNFDEKATGNNETPFFTLNLHALAEQLAKVDVSERLFIESDIIPPELFLELQGSNKREEEDNWDQTTKIEAGTKKSEEIPIHGFSEEDKIVDRYHEHSLSKTTTTSRQVVSASSDKVAKTLKKQVENELWQYGGNGPKSNFTVNPNPNPNNAKQREQKSKFEAAAAEAELDMLLNTFNEKTTFLDDDIDDLLMMKGTNQNRPSQPREVKVAAPLDDFDAWLNTI